MSPSNACFLIGLVAMFFGAKIHKKAFVIFKKNPLDEEGRQYLKEFMIYGPLYLAVVFFSFYLWFYFRFY